MYSHLFLPLVLLWTTVANAIYYIDDADGSVVYNSSAGVGYNKKWRKYSLPDDNLLALAVDPKLLYSGTGSYTQCYTSDDCSITITFNGTGITLYTAQDPGDIYNVTASIDGGPRVTNAAYNMGNSEVYNVTLISVQGLTLSKHTIDVRLTEDGKRMLFDYAAVNGDTPPSKSGGIQRMSAVSRVGIIVALALAGWHL